MNCSFLKNKTLQNTIESILFLLGLGILIYCLYYAFAINSIKPPFSPDSWSYYEIGKNTFKHFGEINTIRQFEYKQYLNISFPLLYPLLISVLNLFVTWGIYAGYILNLLINILILLSLILLSRRLFKTGVFGLFAFSNLIFNKYYLIESLAARSMPLYILLFLLMLIFLTAEGKKPFYKPIIIGGLAGLMVMTRFDFLLPAIVLGIVAFHKERKRIISYFVTFLVAVSPWVVYSMIHFRKFFITDNARTVMSATKNSVSYFYPLGTKPVTIFNDLFGWVALLWSKTNSCLEVFGRYLGQNLPIIFLLLLTVFVVIFVILRDKHFETKDEKIKTLCEFSILFLPLLLLFFSISSTGYTDERYFTLISLFLFLELLLINFALTNFDALPHLGKNFIYLIIIFLIYSNLRALRLEYPNRIGALVITLNEMNIKPIEYKGMIESLDETSDPVLLADSTSSEPFKIGALTGMKTIMTPDNLNEVGLISLVEEYHVTHIVTNNPRFLYNVSDEYNFARIDDSPVYKLINK